MASRASPKQLLGEVRALFTAQNTLLGQRNILLAFAGSQPFGFGRTAVSMADCPKDSPG